MEFLDADGVAVIMQWIDSNGNSRPDESDTWNIIEVVELP